MARQGPIRIGCSGWNYRHWRGSFYPDTMAARHWFAFYAARFATVELNTSFYHLPKPESFAKWRDQAPQGFRYAVKASRFITHARKLKDCEEPLALFLGRARLLGETLGPILYQLPPRWRFDGARLEEFLGLLPSDLVHVFEFREESWMVEEVIALLDAHGASYCTHDMSGMKVPRVAAGPVAYVRFHGHGGKYRGRYPEETLLAWSRWMIAQARQGRAVWAFFNNDIDADAIADAEALSALVGQARI